MWQEMISDMFWMQNTSVQTDSALAAEVRAIREVIKMA